MRKSKLILLLAPMILSGCFDENAKQCEQLYNDPQKQVLAKKYCQQAANEGNNIAQMTLGKLLLSEGNIDQAVNWLEKSAGTNAEARVILGDIYETDKYGKKDLITSLFYYRKGCELGDIKSCKQVNIFEEREKANQANKENIKDKIKVIQAEQTLREERAKFEIEKKIEKQRLAEEQAKLELAQQQSDRNSKIKLKYYEGLAAFKENELYGFVNINGDVVIPPQFKYAGRFSHGRSAVQSNSNDLWGFIDNKGNYVVYPKYCSIAAFSESDGLAGVYENGYKAGSKCVGGKWGFMDTSGKWIIDPVLDYAERFIQGKAKVIYKDQAGYINRYGQWVDK